MNERGRIHRSFELFERVYVWGAFAYNLDMQKSVSCLLIIFGFWAAWTAARAEPLKLAVFNFELIDTSLQGEMRGSSPQELQRLIKISDDLKADLATDKNYGVLDMAPVAAKAKIENLQACGGCEVSLAHEIGADIALTGTVQKVSELILNLNLYLHDVKTGKLMTEMSVDIRSNTDESWEHGLSFLVRNRLPAALAQASR